MLEPPPNTPEETLPGWRWQVSAVLLLASFGWALTDGPVRALWPSVVALTTVLLVRRAFTGLVAGGAAGAIILAGGDPLAAFTGFFYDHLIKNLQGDWKIGPILFTFILGGFVALIEKSGGLQGLARRLTSGGGNPARRLQGAVLGVGLFCFFDGLANSLMVGRVFRTLADRCGVSRVKLAYIVDSTSSAVACVAVVSTWIAFQLSMIKTGFANAEMDARPYAVFFRSIPLNFYCWFTIALLPVAIWRDFHPGPMSAFEERARVRPAPAPAGEEKAHARAWVAILPVGVLITAILLGTYFDGADPLWPVSFTGISEAFGNANIIVVLVCSSALASLVAFAVYPRDRAQKPSEVFQAGVLSLFNPVLILIGAWILGSTLDALEAGNVLSGLLSGRMPVWLLPAAVFLTGAATSFATGTSWGAMGILMPLAIPVAAQLGADLSPEALSSLFSACVAAVFSGAVFGDHCSPISDTTIVSSIACEVEPVDHVRTQMPYALIAALVATATGFIPAGLGVSPWLCLPAGISILWTLPWLANRFRKPA